MPTGVPELDGLPPEQKLMIAEELWRDATRDDSPPEVHDGIAQVLEDRLKHFEGNPESGILWEDLKAKLLSKNG